MLDYKVKGIVGKWKASSSIGDVKMAITRWMTSKVHQHKNQSFHTCTIGFYLMGYTMISVPVKCEFGYDFAISFSSQSVFSIHSNVVPSNRYLHPKTWTAPNIINVTHLHHRFILMIIITYLTFRTLIPLFNSSSIGAKKFLGDCMYKS